MKTTNEWLRAGEHHITRGAVTITRYMVAGTPKYLLWHGETIRGMFATVEDAKRAADGITQTEAAE